MFLFFFFAVHISANVCPCESIAQYLHFSRFPIRFKSYCLQQNCYYYYEFRLLLYLFLSVRIYAINFDDDDEWGCRYCCCIFVWCAMFAIVVYCYIHVELTSSVPLAWWVGRTNKLITIWHHFYWTRFNLDLILSIHRAISNGLCAQCYVNMFRIPTNRYYFRFHCDWMSCTRVLQVIPICSNINVTQQPYQVIIESDREIHIKKDKYK